MDPLSETWSWLTTAANWSGSNGIPTRLAQHIEYSLIGLLVAALIGLPLGLIIGHTGKATFLTFSVSGAVRAIPTLGLLILVFKLDPVKLWPMEIVLVVLAIPPILANTYAGIGAVDPSVRDAAKGMGMRAHQVLARAEVPLGLPLILAGLRSASSQVIATATVVAYGGLGGLGRFILDGYSTQDYGEVYGGAILVAALALISEGVFALVQRRAVSPGMNVRRLSRARPAPDVDPSLGALAIHSTPFVRTPEVPQ